MRHLILLTVVSAVSWGTALAQDAAQPRTAPKGAATRLSTKWLEAMQWRSIGPANMGGRITSVAVYEKDPCKWWAATASGGLLKTVNNGATFEHQFDRENTVSIGDVAVAQSNPDIVWVGTGEANPRNSVSWGDGVYKSIDGGKTWGHMGLKTSFQISSVRIHPKNPDIVYVGALGRLWGAGGERGLFKTVDGGKTWNRIHGIDDKTGVIDVQMHPTDPETLMVATYERQRDGFDTNDPAKKFGPGSGIFKTTDGGKTFKKITNGLPTCKLGRVGIDYYRKDPNTIVMVLESEKIGKEPENAPYIGHHRRGRRRGRATCQHREGRPGGEGGPQEGRHRVVRGRQDAALLQRLPARGAPACVRRHRQAGSVPRAQERDGLGQTRIATQAQAEGRRRPCEPVGRSRGERRSARSWVDSAPTSRTSRARPATSSAASSSPPTAARAGRASTRSTRGRCTSPRSAIDPSDEQKLWVLGIRLWKSLDGGKTFTNDGHGRGVHVDHHAMWIDPEDGRHVILGNDGGLYVTADHGKNWTHHNTVAIGQFYHVGVGPKRNYRVYGGLQDNGSWGGPGRVAHASGPGNTDWMRVGGGDGFICRVDPNDPDQIYFESQNGAVGRRHLVKADRAGFRPRPPKGTQYRFNWQTPFILSNHNSGIYYTAGNYVFRSLNKGNRLKVISPDITHGKRGSATTLAESPRDANVLYVGTDDGALWMTRDGGHSWNDLYNPAKEESKPEAAAPKEQPAPANADAHTNGNGTNGDGDGKKPAKKPVDKDGKKVPVEKAAEADVTKDAAKPEAKPAENEAKKAEKPLSDAAQRMITQLLEMDTNGDGSLQKSEMPERALNMFDRLDANKDGVIDPAELRAMAERRAQRRRNPGAGGVRRGPRRNRPNAPADGKKADTAKEPVDEGKPIKELVPERRWVNHIETSRFSDGRAYVVFDGHRSDDDRPHIYVTENFGKTFRSLAGNLPKNVGTTRVLREDLKNQNLLYLGTEFGAWVSIDRGEHWVSLKTNLPTVAVHAIAIHPTANEIVAATHGRSLWVLDVTTLRQLSEETLAARVTLFAPNTGIQWRPNLSRGAARGFTGSNPSSGAELYYALAKKTEGVTLEIHDFAGNLIRKLEAKGEAGLNHVHWNLRKERPKGRRGRFSRFGPRVEPGTFKVVMKVGEETHTQTLRVAIDPDHSDARWIAAANLEEQMEAERAEASSRRKYPWKHDLGDD